MSWTVRQREANLALTDFIEYSNLTLVENYNKPHRLVLEGRLSEIAGLMDPSIGVYVTDETGRYRFSGIVSEDGLTRRGDKTGEISFDSDAINLWDRICWPSPANAWTGQLAAYDVQTASNETRLLGYIARNAGPLAWHEVPAGVNPGPSPVASPFAVLDPTLNYITQAAAPDPDTNDIYVTQKLDDDNEYKTPDNLWITRFKDGLQVSQMYLPRGGHGDLLEVRRVKGKVHLVFRYRGLSGANAISGTWVSLPWTGGKTWTATQALAYKIPLPRAYQKGNPRPLYKAGKFISGGVPARTDPPARSWFQGEARYGGTFYRMYGKPYDNNGPVDGAMPAFIEVIKNNAITSTIDISNLGRGTNGLPFDGYLEPEGLSLILRDGQQCLLIGICTGKGAARRHRLFTLPLEPDATDDRLKDRRIPRLRVAVSMNRGDSGKTSARFQTLGQLVADIAEPADLRVDVEQTYEGTTPWLDVKVYDAPDMTDTVKVGTVEEGGQIIIGEDWSYRLGRPQVTTALSAAGGELTNRILSTKTDDGAELTWAKRVEALVDQRDTTDVTEIQAGLQTALDDGASQVEVSVPIDDSTQGLGTEIPLGAKVVATLDGQQVVERIRQITTEVGVESGKPTVSVTGVLGTPDVGLTATQKQLQAMLRRLRNLEAR